MSLRTRLLVVLAGLFLLPLAVGGVILAAVLPDARSDRASGAAGVGAGAVADELADTCAALGLAARNAALEAATMGNGQAAVDVVVRARYAEYAALLDPAGRPVATAGTLPSDAGAPDQLPVCSETGGTGHVVAQRVPVSGLPGVRQAVVAVGVVPLVRDRLARLVGADAEVVVVQEGRVVASTGDGPSVGQLAELAGNPRADVPAGWVAAVERAKPLPFSVVVALPEADDGLRTGHLLLVAGAAALAAGLLVAAVARDLSRPYAELTRAAERVARGDLDAPVDTEEEGEAGRLGSALTSVVEELRRSLAELERSRDELRGSLERIGDTLSATHNLDGLLHVVLDTALATAGTRAGLVLYRKGIDLELVAEQGLADLDVVPPTAVRPGDGVLGRVVTSGLPVRGRIGSGAEDLEPSAAEPAGLDVLAVPLRSSGAIVGVLAVYRSADRRPFEPSDTDHLATLAGQAGIAIDNIALHQEAQRLSTTDPLTGVWNFRYLSMSLAREIERSTRFDRPLAVLMLDLDHFKSVNDTYGHARGDAVLRELTHRVMEHIREVDIFARYGGEEFVVVLPETTVEGAAQLADRICSAVRREPFRTEGEQPITVTLSIGGAAFPAQGSTPATLMRAADQALYVAKDRGRDGWFIPGMSSGELQRH